MALITGPVGNVDRAVEHVAKNYMEAMASPIQTVTASLAMLMIIILTINYFLQFKQINYREYLPIVVKVVIVQAIISSWANYSSIYHLLTVFPDRLAGGILNAVGVGNGTVGSIYGIIQGIIGGFIGVGVGFVFATTIFSVGMFVIAQMAFGVAITSISAVLAIVLGAKIALTLAIAIGPLFIPFVIHKSSTPFFQNWLRFTVGAAITPVLFCGMLAVIAAALRAGGGGGLGGIIGSLVIIACSATLIKQIPQIVGVLMGSYTPTAATPTASEIGQAVAKADGKFKNARNADAAINTAQQHLDGVSAETGQEAKLSTTERMQIAAASYRMSNHQQEQIRDSSRIDRMDGALGRAADRAYDAQEAGERPWEQVPTTPTESGDASSANGSGDDANNELPPADSTAAATAALANEAQSNDDDDEDNNKKKKRRPASSARAATTSQGSSAKAGSSQDAASGSKKSEPKSQSSGSAQSASASQSEDKSSDYDADKKEKKKRSRKPTPRPKPTAFREKYYGPRGASSTDDRIARANNKPKSG